MALNIQNHFNIGQAYGRRVFLGVIIYLIDNPLKLRLLQDRYLCGVCYNFGSH